MKTKYALVVVSVGFLLVLTARASAQWGWGYWWWNPRLVHETRDTHTFTGIVESFNSKQMIIRVNGHENFRQITRWDYSYPYAKPPARESNADNEYAPGGGEKKHLKKNSDTTQEFKVAVSCRIITPKNPHATFASLRDGDSVTISHSLDYKNNRVAVEITVDKQKKE